VSIRVEVTPGGGGPLVRDYLAGVPAAARFYSGHPRDPEAYRAKLREVSARFADRAARERVAAALTPTTPRARERLERFVREGGAMVTTGQQAGLFGGPLYTVHKILSAVRLAEALERDLGVPVLPVFWIASEDHDFAEVNHAHVVDSSGELRRVEVSARERLLFSMSRTHLGEDVSRAVEAYAEALGAPGAVREALAGYRPGASVADAFRELILGLFSDFDLFVTRADDPHLKAASVPVLLRAAEEAAAHERIVADRTRELEEAGYAGQVTVLEGATNLFFESEAAGRERLYRDGAGFVAHDSGRRFTGSELRDEIRARPGQFSPNVFLRPVVESAVFPTLAYVGGPAETAYFAQIGPLFGDCGIRPPVVFPRFSATLVQGEVEETLATLGVGRDRLALPEHELLEEVAVQHLPAAVKQRASALRRIMVEGFAELIEAGEGIDPNLGLALGARRDRAMLEIAAAERKVVRHFKRRHPGIAAGLRLARSHLRPLGQPQERVLTVLQYLAVHPSLLHEIAAAMEVVFDPVEAGPDNA